MGTIRDRHNMLLIFPIILCSNSRRYHLLCFAFLPIMLESVIDINVKKHLETISLRGGMCGSFSPHAPDDRFFPFGGRGLQWTFRFRLSSEGRGHFY